MIGMRTTGHARILRGGVVVGALLLLAATGCGSAGAADAGTGAPDSRAAVLDVDPLRVALDVDALSVVRVEDALRPVLDADTLSVDGSADRALDSSGGGEEAWAAVSGACEDPADQAVLSAADWDLASHVVACSRATDWSSADSVARLGACLTDGPRTGKAPDLSLLTPPCAACHAVRLHCLMNHCRTSCEWIRSSCRRCLHERCQSAFCGCAGPGSEDCASVSSERGGGMACRSREHRLLDAAGPTWELERYACAAGSFTRPPAPSTTATPTTTTG